MLAPVDGLGDYIDVRSGVEFGDLSDCSGRWERGSQADQLAAVAGCCDAQTGGAVES